MTPNWMPQNIQKRLLLYVLQQLSLFSEIELPNLDVSLGSNSQVTLSDVELDTDAFQIPGLYLRNGKIKNFRLTLNVSGGVSVQADGLVLTVALASTQAVPPHKSRFSLTQSTMDLANSIIQEGELPGTTDAQSPPHSVHEELPIGDPADAQPSALNSMMSKAAEAALSRLQVNIKDISLRIILDQSTLDVEIKEAKLSTTDGVRTVIINGVMFLGVNPAAYPGGTRPKSPEPEDTQRTSSAAETLRKSEHDDDISNPSSDSEDDDDRENDHDEMMSSSILQRSADLNSSLVYSKKEASSIYMSAASDVFESRRHQMTQSTRLAYITQISLSFSGLTEVDGLKIEVDEVRIAASPIPLTLLHIIESLSTLSTAHDYPRSSNINSKQRQDNNTETPTAHERQNQLFDEFVIHKILVNLVSALDESGSFFRPEEATMVCDTFNLKQVDDVRFYGSLLKFTLEKNGSDFGHFNANDEKSDIRFEMDKRTGDFTLLLGKELTLSLDQETLQNFIDLSSYFPQISESFSRQKSSTPMKKQPTGTTTFQTSLITVNFQLSKQRALKLNISPVSFDSKEGTLSLKKATLYRIESDHTTPILSILNISHTAYANDKQLRTYDNNGHEVVLLTHGALDVDGIDIEHDWESLLSLIADFNILKDALKFTTPEIIFKTRKKARISSNLTFQSRLSVKLLINIKSINFKLLCISKGFGNLSGKFEAISLMIHKEGYIQLHTMRANISRTAFGVVEPFFDLINPDDRSAPILSLRTRDFKTLTVLLRNSTVDYYTKWLGIFDNDNRTASSGESSNFTEISNSDTLPNGPKLEIKLNLVDSAIGLNPGRLSSKANLVIPTGSLDILIGENTMIKSDLRSSYLVLVDDVANIASYEETKTNRGARGSWSQVAYFNAMGYTSVAKVKSLNINVLIKQNPTATYDKSDSTSSVILDINSSLLEVDLCADSSHCLVQLLNDLKQPITIRADAKYKTKKGKEVNVFDDVDEHAFNFETVGYDEAPESSQPERANEPFTLDIVDSYYDTRNSAESLDTGSDILDKDLDELRLTDETLKKNPFFASELKSDTANPVGDTKSENSDSIILFNDGHFGESMASSVRSVEKPFPMGLSLNASKVVIRIHDGYDWKHTRKTISHAVKRIEQKAREQKEKMNIQRQERGTRSATPMPLNTDDQVLGETLFDSIHVSLPITSDPATLTAIINKDLQSKTEEDGNNGIDVGKSNVKKLKLRRSKTHKVLIELSGISVDFSLLSSKDPLNESIVFGDTDYETVSELQVKVKDFEVTDNVETSTWNKFVTYMKDEDRESGSRMLSLEMKTVRPVSSLAATEVLMDVHVLPLRLHADQDTLEVLTRFGEFKDARFALVDEFEDLAYIQKFTINSIHIKLDYKPKKIDYAGLRSGHTTEFMNFFILDEADMVLKSLSLHGISGFPRLGIALNKLWMPDIKSTQLTGVLTGLAPVRSVAKIGTGFKDLIAVPVKEYQKDGRLYRSLSKGIQQFSKTTTNEVIKLGVKLAAGTQAILEHTEEALGGTGAAARTPRDPHYTTAGKDDEYDSEDYDDEDSDATLTRGNYGNSSHLIGRGALSSSMMHRSVYHPTLESIADIRNQGRSRVVNPRSQGLPDEIDFLDGIEGVDDDDDDDSDGPKMVSLYADQPTSIREGFVLAYDSLGRNLLVAKDAIMNAGTEIGESGSAHDTTLAVMKATPVILLRPVIGATEAASKALLGINNQLDPSQRRYIDDKYKQTSKK